HCALGRWLLRRGREEEAVASLQKALQLDPTHPGAHLHLGQAALSAKDLSSARHHLRAELLLRPEDPHMLKDLANLLMDVGEVRGAIACMKRLVVAQPDNTAAWQNLAVAHFLRARYDEGLESCHEALRCEPGNLAVTYN